VEIEANGIPSIDQSYRNEVDTLFKEIYREYRVQVLPCNNGSLLIELWGSHHQMLYQLEQAIAIIVASPIAQ
jgi:hypothetical protein